MKWERKYPEIQMDEEVPDRCLWRSGVISKCFMCGKRTAWVDLCFEAPLCSEECEKAAFEDIARRTEQDAEDRYRPSF
jgi:endogenous inhibitor of DNA gyrase (YacG/DUF329 family)